MVIEKDIVTGIEQVKLENGTKICEYVKVLAGADIGRDCLIGQNCFIAKDVRIGDRTRIQNGNNIYDGVSIGDDCFIAPSVCLTNCNDPSERITRKGSFVPDKTIIGDRVTICTNSSIVAPVMVGSGSMIAAGSIVLRSVRENERVKGIVK